MAILKKTGVSGTTSVGTFYNYELGFTEVAFHVTQFQPHHSDGRETLSRIKSPEGDTLFYAKEHLSGRGSLIFLREVNSAWVIYRLIGLPRNAYVDAVWLVTEEGVSSPAVEQAIDLKQAVAEFEECDLVLSAGEQTYQLLRERQAAEEAATKRRQEQEAVAAARVAQEQARMAARALREERKRQLRSPGNTRSFVTAGGKPWNGFVVKDEAEANLLEAGDRAVFVVNGHVARVVVVQKSRGGRISFEEIALATGPVRVRSSGGSTSQTKAPQLQRFDTFCRPPGKRKEGEPDTVAYYVTMIEFEQLKVNRPEKPVSVVLDEGGRFHVLTIRPDGVDDRGFMEKVVPKEQEVKVVSTGLRTAFSRRLKRYLSV